MRKKITVIGLGYVGISISILISQKHNVIGYDIDKEKVDLINKGVSPIHDDTISKFLVEKKLSLEVTSDYDYSINNPDFIIIALPTNFSDLDENFDTKIIEQTISKILDNDRKVSIIIKSTVPIGFTDEMKKKFGYANIHFSPEFLREGRALHDNLYPSRVIVGGFSESAIQFGNMLKDLSLNKETPLLFMEPSEAEATKLFANSYLAMRVAFFNELDTYNEINNLSSLNIIKGMSYDARIGNLYNNPSFGYGGYCLPKDTQQLISNYKQIPNDIIESIVRSNKTRKKHITNSILNKKVNTVGIYRLVMKTNSDNFKESAILDIAKLLFDHGVQIIIFEPYAKGNILKEFNLYDDLNKFKSDSDLIIANRLDKDLEDIKDKVYSRDIFKNN